MKLNIASMVDGYKLAHAAMYADGTTMVYSNLTPRANKHYLKGASSFCDNKLVFIGAQAAIGEVVEMFYDFFSTEKEEAIGKIKRRLSNYTGEADHDMVTRWEQLHNLAYVPLEFRALPEGSKVNMGIPVMTIRNTHPDFFWLVNYIESLVSSILWKTCTNATIANEYQRMAKYYAEKTGVDDFTVSIQFHDFSVRGMSGPEDAARSGMGHLSSFIGSDNLPAFDYVEKWYGETEGLAMGVPATEHAVATNNILYLSEKRGIDKQQAEKEFLVDLITRKFPDGIVSVVCDSFDYWALISETLPEIKDVILSRKDRGMAPGRLVIRPDSGDPVEVICGKISSPYNTLEEAVWGEEEKHYDKAVAECEGRHEWGKDSYSSIVYVQEEEKYYKITTGFEYNHYAGIYYVANCESCAEEYTPSAEDKGTIQSLWETFGGTVNDKGYKVLDSHIGLIYGDSITLQRAEEIFKRLEAAGFASGNVVLGVGSYTYQASTRDTFGFAVKATCTKIDGEHVAIYKDPKTDSKKKSAKGYLYVGVDDSDEFVLEDGVTFKRMLDVSNQLSVYSYDGGKESHYSFDTIRLNIESQD